MKEEEEEKNREEIVEWEKKWDPPADEDKQCKHLLKSQISVSGLGKSLEGCLSGFLLTIRCVINCHCLSSFDSELLLIPSYTCYD
jgi:hypothetical protein